MSDPTFITFPLALLAMPAKTPNYRLQCILSFAIRKMGQALVAGIGDEDEEIDRFCRMKTAQDFNESDPLHRALTLGAKKLRVKMEVIGPTVHQLNAVDDYLEWYEGHIGASPLVFISIDILWGCHDEQDPSYRDFTVLCAINSFLGLKNPPRVIRREAIIARALGYASPAKMALGLEHQWAEALTTSQLRTSLDRLEDKELTRRFQAGKATVYFARPRTTAEELKAYAMEHFVKGRVKAERRAIELAATQNAVKEAINRERKRHGLPPV